MGGTLWVESQVGTGSRFHLTVRLELADPAKSEDLVLVPSCLHGLRVLVVDDTATNRRILDDVLRHWHMEPTLAESASRALELLHAATRSGTPYQLVLTDAHMPDVDGFSLTKSLREDPTLAATKVIMLTSGDRSEDTLHCDSLGIAAYLLKPAKQSELLEAIEVTLGVLVAKRDLPDAGGRHASHSVPPDPAGRGQRGKPETGRGSPSTPRSRSNHRCQRSRSGGRHRP